MNKKVIVIGDGPSINKYNLNSIPINYDIIYCGNQIFHKDFNIKSNRNTHYIVIEPRLFWPNYLLGKKRNHIKEFKVLSWKMINEFKKIKNISFYLHWTNFLFVRINNLKFISKFKIPGFISLKDIDGSFEACISLASYLGYEEVHLVGFDSFLFKESFNNRWYEKNNKLTLNNTSVYVKSILKKFNKIRFKVISDEELILNSYYLNISNVRLEKKMESDQLIDSMNEDAIDIFKKIKIFNLKN